MGNFLVCVGAMTSVMTMVQLIILAMTFAPTAPAPQATISSPTAASVSAASDAKKNEKKVSFLIQASVAERPQPDSALARDQMRLEHPAPFAPKRAATARSEATMLASRASTGQGGKATNDAAFVAARPIRETQANLTASISRTLTSPVEVQVKVRIDESGRVIRADPVALTGPASHALFAATENAALLWKFAPAMRGNQPIASEAVLKFSYAPTR
jgi:hypothetical protein